MRHAILAAALAVASAGLLPAAGLAPETRTIVAVWWNLRNYRLEPARDDAGKITTPAKSADSIDAIVRTLAEIRPDILGLTEIGTRRDLEDLQRRLKKTGVDLPHAAWVDAEDQYRHLALLSKFPLEERHDTTSTVNASGIPRPVQRGFLDCSASVQPDFSLRILGAHFKSQRIVPEFDQAEQRRGESLLLRQRVASILARDPATRLLLFGDLNDTKNSPAVSCLTGRRGTPAAMTILQLDDRQGDSWTYHWSESDEYNRIDYIMASNALRRLVDRRGSIIPRKSDWMKASDHRPLVVTINLPSPPAKP